MAGTCLTYKKKLIIWDSGCGAPYDYIYAVIPKDKKKGSIEFGYNDRKEHDECYKKVLDYIDKHKDELQECNNTKAMCYYDCIKHGLKRRK